MFWRFWLNLEKYEFDLVFSLGIVLLGVARGFPNFGYRLGELLVSFSQTLNLWVSYLSGILWV
jgi:hypothetical protein